MDCVSCAGLFSTKAIGSFALCANMHGLHTAAASSSSAPKLNEVPRDAQMLVIGEALSTSTVQERGVVLVGIVV